MAAVSPMTKAARHAQIAAILSYADQPVRSQEELADRLAQRGARVTQATLSRDLEELGAVRLRGAGGMLVYALPGEPGGPGSRPGGLPDGGTGGTGGTGGNGGGTSEPAGNDPGSGDGLADGDRAGPLARVAAELLLAAEASANLVVLRTPAGAAQFLASVLDHANLPAVLGTVAGDDTVLVISRDPAGGDDLARGLLALAERRSSRATGLAPERPGDLGTPLRRKT
jgi:transcriptional regulator of arginine metabolism